MYLENLIKRSEEFAATYGAKSPIMLGPMAGACPVELSIAVANGGGMGACGALLMQPEAIKKWATEFRAGSVEPFQLNLWIPDAPAARNNTQEARIKNFLNQWGPEVSPDAANNTPPNFQDQCEALLDIAPPVISSIMGLFDHNYVERMHAKGIKWFANVTTVSEAQLAQTAGADVIIAKGMEGGGHSGAFKPDDALRQSVGLFSLVPAIIDAVDLPVVAAGGISDAQTAMAALMLGASAVQIGTGFLRTPEARITPAWADAIAHANPENTIATCAFSGRLGRSIATKYALAMDRSDAPDPAPYPIQRGLTQVMRDAGSRENNIDCIQAWAGQSAKRAQDTPALKLTQNIWSEMYKLGKE